MKQTIFDNKSFTTNLDSTSPNITQETIQANLKTIHSVSVQSYLQTRQPNKIIAQIPPPIHKLEQTLPRKTRRTLAQLRTNKSPFLMSYLHKINPTKHTSPLCPLCKAQNHDTTHLFNCTFIRTNLQPLDIRNDPIATAELLQLWTDTLAAAGGGGSGAQVHPGTSS